jgi:hypothetical protein
MLVYATSFLFEPNDGPEQIIRLVAQWVTQRAKNTVDASRLAEGIRELKLKDGSTLSSRVTMNDERQAAYPYFFCARLSHGDDKVSGRRWTTEIGLRQENKHMLVECSILLKTDEVSARVIEPIQVTRPKLVQQLVAVCRPVGHTPGLIVKRLDEASAPAFLREVEREERASPIVLVSCPRNGAYPVEAERLRSILVGLADVVDVPSGVDTFAVQEIVGRRYIAFGGAINILFPMRRGDRGLFCETVLFRPNDIQALQNDGKAIESEVLAAITHRTNLPYSWRHISPEMVSQAILRSQLARVIEKSKTSDHSGELSEYTALLEEADRELQLKDDELARLRTEFENKSNETRKLHADIGSLKHALNGRQTADSLQDNEIVDAMAPLRESVSAVLKGDPSLQQALELVAALYVDRVVVLDTAFDSAKESDRGGFKIGSKAHELLLKLVTDYWQTLADGKSDQQAKAVFGQNAYAANEASALSNDGKRRRTFLHHGREFLMEKHLKHGVKDSLAETLRVHFEWLASEKRIIVGQCGKHLDF